VTTLTATGSTGELITATSGGQLTYWQLTENTWLHLACDRAGRDLSSNDWHRVVALAPRLTFAVTANHSGINAERITVTRL
jgi:hypothetical protein